MFTFAQRVYWTHVQWGLWSRDIFQPSLRRVAASYWETSIVAFERIKSSFCPLNIVLLRGRFEPFMYVHYCTLFCNPRSPFMADVVETVFLSVSRSHVFLYPSTNIVWEGWQTYVTCTCTVCWETRGLLGREEVTTEAFEPPTLQRPWLTRMSSWSCLKRFTTVVSL